MNSVDKFIFEKFYNEKYIRLFETPRYMIGVRNSLTELSNVFKENIGKNDYDYAIDTHFSYYFKSNFGFRDDLINKSATDVIDEKIVKVKK